MHHYLLADIVAAPSSSSGNRCRIKWVPICVCAAVNSIIIIHIFIYALQYWIRAHMHLPRDGNDRDVNDPDAPSVLLVAADSLIAAHWSTHSCTNHINKASTHIYRRTRLVNEWHTQTRARTMQVWYVPRVWYWSANCALFIHEIKCTHHQMMQWFVDGSRRWIMVDSDSDWWCWVWGGGGKRWIVYLILRCRGPRSDRSCSAACVTAAASASCFSARYMLYIIMLICQYVWLVAMQLVVCCCDINIHGGTT